MRITQNIMHTGALAGYQQNLRQIAVAQERVATGLHLLKPSDDPAAANQVMQAAGSLRALDQYRRNIDAARSRVDAEETLYDQLSNVLVRAREIAFAQANGTSDASARQLANAEVEQILHFAVQLANTQVSGTYLLGGTQAEAAPAVWDDPDAGPPVVTGDPGEAGHHRVEVAAGQTLQTAKNAHEVFTDTGVFQALWDLSAALGNDDGPAIRAAADVIDDSFTRIQALVGDAGARSVQLQVTSANLDALELNLRTLRADIEEIDLEKAITDLVNRQTTFQAAMIAASRVMGMSLTDYLR